MPQVRRSLPSSDRIRTSICGLGRTAKAFRTNSRGVAAVEFAFLIFPFFLIVLAIIETTSVFVGEMNLNQAVSRASRFVRTGEIVGAALDKDGLRNKVCSEIFYMLDCKSIVIDLRAYGKYEDVVTSPPVENGQLNIGAMAFDKVAPGQIMALRAFYEWPLYSDLFRMHLSDLSGGRYLLKSVVVFKTEPFSGS